MTAQHTTALYRRAPCVACSCVGEQKLVTTRPVQYACAQCGHLHAQQHPDELAPPIAQHVDAAVERARGNGKGAEPHVPHDGQVGAIDCCDATAIALEKERDDLRERADAFERELAEACRVSRVNAARAEAAERELEKCRGELAEERAMRNEAHKDFCDSLSDCMDERDTAERQLRDLAEAARVFLSHPWPAEHGELAATHERIARECAQQSPRDGAETDAAAPCIHCGDQIAEHYPDTKTCRKSCTTSYDPGKAEPPGVEPLTTPTGWNAMRSEDVTRATVEPSLDGKGVLVNGEPMAQQQGGLTAEQVVERVWSLRDCQVPDALSTDLVEQYAREQVDAHRSIIVAPLLADRDAEVAKLKARIDNQAALIRDGQRLRSAAEELADAIDSANEMGRTYGTQWPRIEAASEAVRAQLAATTPPPSEREALPTPVPYDLEERAEVFRALDDVIKQKHRMDTASERALRYLILAREAREQGGEHG